MDETPSAVQADHALMAAQDDRVELVHAHRQMVVSEGRGALVPFGSERSLQGLSRNQLHHQRITTAQSTLNPTPMGARISYGPR
jgi:hypothetical protein